jgi:hypothetical protein
MKETLQKIKDEAANLRTEKAMMPDYLTSDTRA